MAEEEVGDSDTLKTEMKEAAMEIEVDIKAAMRSRVGHFQEQADSLTFEGVRRLLEKDMGMETYALDVHKRFIKHCLLECLNEAGDGDVTKNSEEDVEKNISSTRGEATESPDGLESKRDEKEPGSEDEDKMEGSPVLGLLTGHKTTKFDTEETKGNDNKEVLSETTIKKAIRKRASYFKANSEKVTMAGVRRLLEGDLKLDKHSLDSYKNFISEQLEEVLNSIEVSKAAAGVKKKSPKINSRSKASKKISSEGSSDSLDSKSEEAEEDDVKPKKRIASKGKTQNIEQLKKRKRPTKETKEASKKGRSENSSDAEDDGNVSEDSHSQSSTEKPVKKKEVPTPTYGKHVEHLKSVIKSCGMSVPPSVYKKVKQAPENKREAHLIKELEEILSREGLSANPSEKEIKEVRKRKERAKELEGIDMSNIVSSSRRRATGFVAPPKPKIPVESDGDDAEDTDNDDDSDDENDDEDDDDNNGEDDSQSDELDEDNDEDSD
ncbi:hypothetical protein L1049_025822 [Liquidambar formosana]|uniref:DEK-C domain-containing protein n=1 Tax=Liquidambar formosana TaxID=63359 RepID=A0AAP0NEC8_LIQFO